MGTRRVSAEDAQFLSCGAVAGNSPRREPGDLRRLPIKALEGRHNRRVIDRVAPFGACKSSGPNSQGLRPGLLPAVPFGTKTPQLHNACTRKRPGIPRLRSAFGDNEFLFGRELRPGEGRWPVEKNVFTGVFGLPGAFCELAVGGRAIAPCWVV